MSKVFAVGDIHGCFEPLKEVIEQSNIDASDTVVFLGDYVDRGPQSKDVIEYLIQLKTRFHVIYIMGNHEEMMLASRTDKTIFPEWVRFGGKTTLESYGLSLCHESLFNIPEAHWDFLSACVKSYETDDYIFSHAAIDMDIELNKQSSERLRWNKRIPSKKHLSGKPCVSGHIAQRDGQVLDLGYYLCIDTHVYGDGWLTCMDMKNKSYVQANLAGNVRRGKSRSNIFKRFGFGWSFA